MKFSSESKFFLGIILATLAIIGIAAVFLSKPIPTITIPKETLISASTHTKGNKDANVYLVEFSDFQCPSCKAFASTVSQITEKYKDRLFFAYRHFPLTQHKFAKSAAIAAEAAGKQGKFWEADTILFENQEKFSDDFFTNEFVQLAKLDKSQYDEDIKSKELVDLVDRDAQTATLLSLPGTPTFFLNGVMLKNLTSPADLVTAVENALQNKP